MKNNKGFTLIELLAVIVVLAIISLITVPLLLNVIDKAKKGAAEASALGYVDAIEKQVILSQVDKTKELITDGVYDVPMNNISIKGKGPDLGWVVIEKSEITNYSMLINGYVITKGSKTIKGGTVATKPVVGTSGPTKIIPTNGETYKAIMYMDPTDITKTCNASNTTSETGKISGCMKWYAYKDNGDKTYQWILDHNTTAVVAQADIETSLASDITGWDSSLDPKLITADEIASITLNPTFKGETAKSNEYFYFDTNSTSKSDTCTTGNTTGCKYGWLYDRTNIDCNTYGCLNNADATMTGFGYWTTTPISNWSGYLWKVERTGFLYSIGANGGSGYGIRPVITA